VKYSWPTRKIILNVLGGIIGFAIIVATIPSANHHSFGWVVAHFLLLVALFTFLAFRVWKHYIRLK